MIIILSFFALWYNDNMKTHAIIPVFIPHRGCPNDCVFCNQKAITARSADVRPEDVRNLIEEYLPTLQGRSLETIEAAFFGGSFTGLPLEEQSAFLAVVKEYKDRGDIHKIHMSTRPDYIDRRVLDNLKAYGTDIIELGAQSFDPGVLEASGRGHTAEDTYRACRLIREYGFDLGIQLMIGLPGDSMEKCIFSAKETVRMKPASVRLYPTVVLNGTALHDMYRTGAYTPLTTEEAVSITKEMYRILDAAGITILRVGLKSTDLIADGGEIHGGSYHPAFRQLVEGALAREQLEKQLKEHLEEQHWSEDARPCPHQSNAPQALGIPDVPQIPGMSRSCSFTFTSSRNSFSNMVGNAKRNKQYFAKNYPHLKIRWKVDSSLEDGRYIVVKY